jgi:di/tricarboxylate transporter
MESSVTGEAWLTLGVVVATVAVLATERISAPIAVLGAVTALLLADVIDSDQALAGFSNPAPITVAALYVLAAAVDKTGVLDRVMTAILTPASAVLSRLPILARLLVPTAAASAFLNNTPIVAMVAPAVTAWARRTGQSASRYLMPVSFAAILGGLLTLIGTSTNLVVSGLLEDSGREPMGLFEIGKVGLPIAIAGTLVLVILSPRLLPARRAPSEEIGTDARDFMVEMLIGKGSPLVGRSVAGAGLRNLEGVFLVEIERHGRNIAPVGPDEVLVEEDRLTFAGNVVRVLDLHKLPGLISTEEQHFSVLATGPRRRFFEVVVAENSPLAGSTLKEAGFRARYAAAVIAIHRAGERITSKLGEIALRHGDVLLVIADSGFRKRWVGRGDFLVIASLDGDTPQRREKSGIVGLVLVALLATVGTGVLDILEASLATAFALVALRVLSANEARNAIDLNVVAVIAGSFGLGAAITSSGLANEIASTVIEPLGEWGNIGLLAAVLVATQLITELISNNAAAVLMFPIGLAIASQTGLDPRPFAIAIALGASASFLTPIGYQTNMMVYGMGGYRFSDFARVGFVLNIVVIGVGLVVIPRVWPLT